MASKPVDKLYRVAGKEQADDLFRKKRWEPNMGGEGSDVWTCITKEGIGLTASYVELDVEGDASMKEAGDLPEWAPIAPSK